jgi:soluble lytic murein transglycosylase-like protein
VSVSTAVARIAELQSMLAGSAVQAAPAPVATTASFATQLASAAAPAGDAARTLSATTAAPAPAGTSELPASVPYGDQITAAARRHGLDPALLAGLIRQESGFNPSAGSSAGAQGLTQLMPGTAAGLGVTNSLDPAQAIEGGAKYLAQQLKAFGGDVARGLAAYNAGPGAVQRFGGVPPYAETQNYVRKVQAFAAEYRAAAPTPSIL